MGMQWKGLTGIGKELGYAQFISPTRKIAVNNGNANTLRIGEEDSTANGTRYLYRNVVTGFDEEFNWEQWVTARNIGEILELALGEVVTTPLGGSEFQHDFSIADVLPSFTISVDRGDMVNPTFQVAGCKINTFTLENSARGVLQATVDGVGKMHRRTGALTLSDADRIEWGRKPFIFQQLYATKGYAGAAQAVDLRMMRVSISLGNNLVTDKVTSDGGYYINSLPEGELMVTGAFDKEFDNYDDYEAFIGDQQLDLTLTWTGELMSAYNHKLVIDIPNAVITSEALPEVAGGSDQMTFTVEFTGKYYVTDSKCISMQLINDIASYG
jgi:hypothetical protein